MKNKAQTRGAMQEIKHLLSSDKIPESTKGRIKRELRKQQRAFTLQLRDKKLNEASKAELKEIIQIMEDVFT